MTMARQKTGRWIVAGFAILVIVLAGLLLTPGGEQQSSGPEVEKENGSLERLPIARYRFPGAPPESTFEGAFPEMPARMMVYKVEPPGVQVSEADVRELAGKYFGMPSDAEFVHRSGRRRCKLKTGTHIFYYDPQNGYCSISKIDKTRGQEADKAGGGRLSMEEAERLVTNYMTRRGLESDDLALDNITLVSDSTSVSAKFVQLINGYKAWGPDAEIALELDSSGEVLQGYVNKCNEAPYRKYPIKTPREAFEEVAKGNAFMGPSGGVIHKVSIRYQRAPGVVDYLVPVYYFEYKGRGNRYAVVPAIAQDHLMSEVEMDEESKRREAAELAQQAAELEQQIESGELISREKAIEFAREAIEGEVEYEKGCEAQVEYTSGECIVTFIDDAAKKHEDPRRRYAARVWLDGKTGKFVKVLSPRL